MVWATTKDRDSGGKHIFWTPNLGIHVKKVSGEIKGDVSETTFLAHEFGNSWLAQFSPKLNSLMENFNGSFGNNDPEHDTWILPKVENIFAKSRREGIRLKYNSVVESKKDLPRGIINTTKGRHRTKVAYKIQKP